MRPSLPPIVGPGAWKAAYTEVADQIPALAKSAGQVLCLSNACIDIIARLVHLEQAAVTSGSPEAVELFDLLRRRALNGVGGEIRWQSEGLPNWLRRLPDIRQAIGGTGLQAAWALSEIRAPALAALSDRSANMRTVLPPRIKIAQDGDTVSGEAIRAETGARPEIFIFEFSRGEIVSGKPLPRSSRFIVRFDDPGLERDEEFVALSNRFAGEATALVGGLGSVAHDRIDVEIAYLRELSRSWRKAGLTFLHLELGGYADKMALAAVLDAAGEMATSLGMSASEFPDVSAGQAPSPDTMLACAEWFEVERLCVHADDWAASVTRHTAANERQALLVGSLLAAARAEAGQPVAYVRPPADADYKAPPFQDRDLSRGWTFACVATPHLETPEATIGLGDTFTAGCTLVYGQHP